MNDSVSPVSQDSTNLFFMDGQVGLAICEWLTSHFRQDIGLVVTTGCGPVQECVQAAGVPFLIYSSESALLATIDKSNQHFDWGFLVWWPKIIGRNLIQRPKQGFVNTHPSFLPYNRGKHYNFWALVEEAPFGVSLHFVEEGIDSGDIVAQTSLSYDWEDTGATLYAAAQEGMIELFKSTYPQLRAGQYTRTPQNRAQGSFHLARELELASRIDLDKKYTASEILNLLRARTFSGHPACWFEDKSGKMFEARIEIKRKQV
ncbi:MAG: formyltransferase family protein [Thiohalocapsa sp.]